MWVQSLGREDPLENEIATHPIILAQKSHGQRSLVGYSGLIGLQRAGLDRATRHTTLSCSSSVSSWPQLCIIPMICNGLFWQEPALGFPGGPVVKTPSFHCRGCGFHPWVREDPARCLVQPKRKRKEPAFSYISCYSISRDFVSKNCNLPHLHPSLFSSQWLSLEV